MNTTRTPAAPEVEQRVRLILSGSCTPACDLLALVEAGTITEDDATRALRMSGRRGAEVRSEAAAECENMRRLDI